MEAKDTVWQSIKKWICRKAGYNPSLNQRQADSQWEHWKWLNHVGREPK